MASFPPRPSSPSLRGHQVLALLLAALALLPLTLLQPMPAAAATGTLVGAAADPRALAIEQAEAFETLRLRVPAAARACWSQAEASSWESWLAQQPGYRGRQLFWDPERQEGVLLIGWARRRDWKAIPTASLDRVQERFENAARRCLAKADPAAGDPVSGERPTNPFPIVSTGELVLERRNAASIATAQAELP